MMTKGSSVPNSTDCLQILTFFHSVKRCIHSCSRRPRKPLAYNEKNPNKIFIDIKHVSTHLHHVQQIPYLVHSTFSKHFIWCTLRSTNTIFGALFVQQTQYLVHPTCFPSMRCLHSLPCSPISLSRHRNISVHVFPNLSKHRYMASTDLHLRKVQTHLKKYFSDFSLTE